jgi:hypothetical protein
MNKIRPSRFPRRPARLPGSGGGVLYFCPRAAALLIVAVIAGAAFLLLKHDPEKWMPVFLGTNAKRLPGDHAQTKG